MNWEQELEGIFEDPIFADVKPAQVQPTSADRLVASFEEVNAFYEMHKRLPEMNGDTNEKRLARRFEGIICDIKKQQRCLPYDRFGLIKTQEVDVDAELRALFDSPLLAMTKESEALFDVPEHLKKEVEKSAPDFVAQREKCSDFELYESRFKQVHNELNNGKRSLIRFQESHIKEGTYFLVGGVLVLLDKILGTKKDKNHKIDGRTYCVFENGTESNLLLRSLAKALYLDGYTVQESKETDENCLKESFRITDEDVATGYIYVLASKSTNPAITQYKELYKIGFTTGSVEERIANASQESTYLLDDVEVAASWKTYNLNVSYFENMLHKLFGQAQLQVKIHHHSGVVIVPKEWFIVPLPIIQKAIDYIIRGIPVSYNAKEQALEEHRPERFVSKIDTSKLKVLVLNIKEVYFSEIIKGSKTEEYRKVKPTTINKYTYIDPKDGKRWLKPYDAIKFYVGYHKDRDSAFIKVKGVEFDRDNNTVIYTLGEIIEQNVMR
ncbi:MAG: GIY-YIG nuclease family protein [Bacteroides sp.]|uniref:GIY-YIG nuclease family protein n=1 Tax=Bacteroides sp. TaxID=29523 RepID=UPI001B7914E9|nr:GIY-YIG nuclease family protein [Bacteroides sp.]MBP9586798.1 GIY-YIG nuclease family protein [Bacteroides sp.]